MEGIISPPMAQGSKGTFSPLVISMLGIVVTTTAIILYHFLLLKYCRRRHAAATAAAQTNPISSTTTGVDQKVLQTIPIFTFSAVKRCRFRTDQEECVVCLGELEDEDTVRLLPNCNHAFHVPCIDEWFSAHTSCPLCRSPIRAEPNTAPYRSTHRHSTNDSSDRASRNEYGTSNSSGESELSPRVQSSGLLRHCVSLALPAVERTPASLKRSLSMDQSFVIINLQSVNCSCTSSSSRSELTRSDQYSTRSSSHFNRVSSKLLRSFSRLRLGKASDAPILPY